MIPLLIFFQWIGAYFGVVAVLLLAAGLRIATAPQVQRVPRRNRR
jgi:hypothetical protein